MCQTVSFWHVDCTETMGTEVSMDSIRRASLITSTLAWILVGPACGEPSGPRGTARFSTATPEQLELVLANVYAPWTFTLSELLVASLDSAMSEGQCPQIEWLEARATITGNGCATAGGVVYEGSIEHQEQASGTEETVFRDFRRIAADGDVSGCDGSVHIDAADDEPGRAGAYDVAMTIQTSWTELVTTLSATCHRNTGGQTECVLEPGARSTLDGLGSFALEGHHTLDLDTPGGTLVLHGAETMRVSYQPDGCVLYEIEDQAPRTWCRLGGGNRALP